MIPSYNQVSRSPILELLSVRKNFDRASPFVWIFLFSLVLVLAGFSFSFLRGFVFLGGFLLIIYAVLFILFVWSNFG